MENEISTALDTLKEQESELTQEVSDRNDDAINAISDLHSSIYRLHALHQNTKETVLGVNDFIEVIRNKFIKVNLENMGRNRDEIINLIDNISWSIRELIDKVNKFDKDLTGQD